jgi:hypothetical protein
MDVAMKQKAWKFPAKCRIQPIQGWQKQGLAPEILRQPPTSRSYEIGKTRFAFLLEMVMFIHHEFFYVWDVWDVCDVWDWEVWDVWVG